MDIELEEKFNRLIICYEIEGRVDKYTKGGNLIFRSRSIRQKGIKHSVNDSNTIWTMYFEKDDMDQKGNYYKYSTDEIPIDDIVKIDQVNRIDIIDEVKVTTIDYVYYFYN